jgi:membrane protease subunit HflK
MGWEDRRKPHRGGGSGGFNAPPDFDFNKVSMPPLKPAYIALVIAVALMIWLSTGFFRVELQEQAVVMIFGKPNPVTTDPGLHWNFPGPIGQVIKVKTEEIKRVEIGYRKEGADRVTPVLQESIMLTEGANMIDIHMSVQYQIKDPIEFLFGVADVDRKLEDRGLYETIKDVSEAALREVVGATNIDDILTVGKNQVQIEVYELMQGMLDRYGAGIRILQVQLQDVHPPEKVRASFIDVNNAEEDKNRLIREAEGYQNSIIPEARGASARVISLAEAYKQERISRSTGEAVRFESQLAEYRKAPEITLKRLYLETMERVMAKVNKVVVDPKVADSVLPLLNIDPKRVVVQGGN